MSEDLDVNADLGRVLALADEILGGRDESMRWLGQPLETFHGQTPEHLVAIGRADDLLGYLNSISNGYVG